MKIETIPGEIRRNHFDFKNRGECKGRRKSVSAFLAPVTLSEVKERSLLCSIQMKHIL
jgi:hypothetical protein